VHNAGWIIGLAVAAYAIQSLMGWLWVKKVRDLRRDIVSLREFVRGIGHE